MIIEMESDRSLDPANVELRGEVTDGNLFADTPDAVYATGDRMRQGDTLRVAAAYGDTLRLVWTGPDGDQSTVLSALQVPERGSSVSPGVPEPTLECDWVDSETTSGDLQVTQANEFEAGAVVACDSFADTADSTVEVAGDNEITVDWRVSAGASTLSVVTVAPTDAEGDPVGEESWFLDSQEATGSITLSGLDAEAHSVTLGISDQRNEFRQAITLTTPT